MAKDKERTVGKTRCGISYEHFMCNAIPLTVRVGDGGVMVVAGVKEYATGSLGWSCSTKTIMEIGGVPVAVQVSLNVTLINSKELPKG